MSTKKQIAYKKIKELIINNEVEKNTPLVERQLCELIGVSRTPIREALRELANEDLVEIIDGKGVYVKRMDFRDMVELFEVREALESMAVRLFTERLDTEYRDKFKVYMEEQKEAYNQGDQKTFMDVEKKIHLLIAEGSKNRRLNDEIVMIYDQMKQIAISARDDEEIRSAAMESHSQIFEAVMSGKAEDASRIMVRHIKETLELNKERYYLL